MNEQELGKLNRKMAEFGEFTLEVKKYEASFVDGVEGTPFDVELWTDIEGEPYGELDFTESLDACFKWLVPKLWLCYLVLDEGIFYVWKVGHPDINGGKLATAVDENPAQALCLVIEKLIDEDT